MKEWKKIPNYNRYEASTDGEIKTFNWKNKGIERIMKPAFDKQGYLRTMLKNDVNGKFNTIKVHRIIAKTFKDNKENKETINHINGIKHDNRVVNLEWATRSENLLHAYRLGLASVKGELNPATTLTNKQVLEIRGKYTYGRNGGRPKKGEVSKTMLAKEYNVKTHVIKLIVTKKTWKHLL